MPAVPGHVQRGPRGLGGRHELSRLASIGPRRRIRIRQGTPKRETARAYPRAGQPAQRRFDCQLTARRPAINQTATASRASPNSRSGGRHAAAPLPLFPRSHPRRRRRPRRHRASRTRRHRAPDRRRPPAGPPARPRQANRTPRHPPRPSSARSTTALTGAPPASAPAPPPRSCCSPSAASAPDRAPVFVPLASPATNHRPPPANVKEMPCGINVKPFQPPLPLPSPYAWRRLPALMTHARTVVVRSLRPR